MSRQEFKRVNVPPPAPTPEVRTPAPQTPPQTPSRPSLSPVEASRPLRTYRVELGFPDHGVQTIFDVGAASEAEAFDILCKWFRQRLRVVG